MKTLKLAKDLSLPLEAVTQKLAWLGVTGSGKTYGASKLAEQMWHAGAQIIVLDPVGVWFGLRLAKDGKHPSDLTIPIFGGLHADVPLEPTGGAFMANLIVDKTLSAIIDVSQFESDAQKARFAHDFADRLFFRKKAAPSALHLFLEECQEFVPQNPMRGEEQMLHVFIRMQKLGRNFGMGSSYISQRPQEVNKKALNMAQTLFVFRTTGSHERVAIEKWIQDKALDQDIANDLPKIPTGDCHVWSPEFLKISETVHVLEKETFNASATPEVGVTAKARELAPIDLEQVRTDMAATIEKAKADDPKELRKQIAQLNTLLGKQSLPTGKTVEKPVLTAADLVRLDKLRDAIVTAVVECRREHQDILIAIREQGHRDVGEQYAVAENALVDLNLAMECELEKASVKKLMAKLFESDVAGRSGEPTPRTGTPVRDAKPRPATPRSQVGLPAEGLDGAQQKIVDVVAMLDVRGIDANRDSVARWLSIHPNGGRYGTNLAYLRAEGYLDGFTLTEQGARAARAMETGLAAAKDPLDGAQRVIVDTLDLNDGKRFTRDTLAEALGIHPNGGRYGTNLARLRTMGLIPERGEIFLTEEAHR